MEACTCRDVFDEAWESVTWKVGGESAWRLREFERRRTGCVAAQRKHVTAQGICPLRKRVGAGGPVSERRKGPLDVEINACAAKRLPFT